MVFILKRKESIEKRILYFIIGMAILVFLAVYSFNLMDLPRITFIGIDITVYAFPPILILFGIYGSSLVKSAFTGKKEIDV